MDENAQIAAQLREAAALVEAQGGNHRKKAAAGNLRTIAPSVAARAARRARRLALHRALFQHRARTSSGAPATGW